MIDSESLNDLRTLERIVHELEIPYITMDACITTGIASIVLQTVPFTIDFRIINNRIILFQNITTIATSINIADASLITKIKDAIGKQSLYANYPYKEPKNALPISVMLSLLNNIALGPPYSIQVNNYSSPLSIDVDYYASRYKRKRIFIHCDIIYIDNDRISISDPDLIKKFQHALE